MTFRSHLDLAEDLFVYFSSLSRITLDMESTAALEKVSNPPTEIVQPVNSEASSSTQPLSKKARKRLAKAAWIAEQKKGRRAAEKERRREKKRLLAEKRAAGELEEGYEGEQSGSNKKRRVEEFKGPKKPFGARVVVDLGFDNMMSENVRMICSPSFGAAIILFHLLGNKISHFTVGFHL